MPRRNIKITIATACLLFAHAATAQDLHFSQFFNSPHTTNPARGSVRQRAAHPRG